MKHVWIPLVFASALSGCAVPQQHYQPPVQRIPFPTSEYDALQKNGTASVKGQVFMKTIGGDVKYGAGSTVYLQPVTSYSTQWYKENYLLGRPLTEPDPRAAQGQLSTQADGGGNFTFTNVPAGNYYLSSDVRWSAPSQYGLLPQGGVVAKFIVVNDGKQSTEMLTK